jgi:predicted metalloprotease with PDZ domain
MPSPTSRAWFVASLSLAVWGLGADPASGAAPATAGSAPPARAPLVEGPYPGVLTLKVDLTDAARRIFAVKETIPARPGPMSLSFPKWIPGEHGPTGPVEGVTGLRITAGGARVDWRRDLEDMYTLHLVVPAGAAALGLEFQFLSSTGGGNFGAGVSATPRLVVLEWNQVLFYPTDYHTARIAIEPTVRLPAGWGFGTALERTSGAPAGGIAFKRVSVDELVDSPLMAGRHWRRIDLSPGVSPPVHLNVVADRPANLQITDTQVAHHRALVKQAAALFGGQRYDRYEFLLALSEKTNHFGLEHHQSSDNRGHAEFFTSPTAYLAGPVLLPHEYVHSWNGKFRRPGGLVTPNFGAPMKTDLLWVYEGLTNYLGEVLAARAGMWTPGQYRDALAITAARMDHRPGRAWRPLRDTADNAQVLYDAPAAWSNYRRGVDFYAEGSLLWLDVDTRIRELSQGRHSLDDFVRAFYADDRAYPQRSHDVKPYDFEDIVKALEAVQPGDWRAWLRARLDATTERAPLDGIARGGWKLVYTDTPTEMVKAEGKDRKRQDFMSSLGFMVASEKSDGHQPGDILDVLWNGPAFAAGLAPGLKLVAVDGEAYDPEGLVAAIKRARQDKAPIALLVHNLDYYSTLKVDYTGGERYPRLVRAEGKPDLLTAIASPR